MWRGVGIFGAFDSRNIWSRSDRALECFTLGFWSTIVVEFPVEIWELLGPDIE